jgi:hypothetical protein
MVRSSMALFCMVAACASVPPPPPEDQGSRPPSSENDGASDGADVLALERGIYRTEADDAAAPRVSDARASVRMLVRYGDVWHAAKPGAQVESETRFKFSVRLAQPGCVYMLYCDAQEHVQPLFPWADETPCLPAGEYTVPDPHSEKPHFILDDQTGEELVYVVVTDRPVADAHPELAARISDMAGDKCPDLAVSRAEPREDTPEPKRTRPSAGYDSYSLDPRARGEQGVRNGGASVDARADSDGVVIIPYPFVHID